MVKKREHLYEGMYIISAKLSDDARKKAIEKIQKEITDRGGEILKVHDQGRKRLAYDINGHREGYYYIIYFRIETSAIAEMWREYHLNEDLVRFQTLQTEHVMEEISFKPIEISQ